MKKGFDNLFLLFTILSSCFFFPLKEEHEIDDAQILLHPAASVYGLSPVTSSTQEGLIRPVSYYAFFKGWLLLSQPPGCLGFPTFFPT